MMLLAGVEVVSFMLTDLAYAPEIAGQMLVRQQAQAVLDARKLIVHGATEIAVDALNSLESRGKAVPGPEQSHFVRTHQHAGCLDTSRPARSRLPPRTATTELLHACVMCGSMCAITDGGAGPCALPHRQLTNLVLVICSEKSPVQTMELK